MAVYILLFEEELHLERGSVPIMRDYIFAAIAIVILLIPSVLWQTLQTSMDLNVKTFLQVLPSIAMSELIFTSLLETFKFQDIWSNIVNLFVFIIIIFILVLWIIKRMDL